MALISRRRSIRQDSANETNQWLHELELHELDGLESVAGPTSVGIGVESIGPDTLRSKAFGLHILPGLFRLFGQGILL